jgi:hypothetical protein
VSVPVRRKQVAYSRERGLSARRACTLFSVARSALGYLSRKAARDAKVVEHMAALSAQYPRYGYRRIQIFLARDGHEPRAGVSAVATGEAAGAAQARTQTCGGLATATPDANCGEPGLELRLRVRQLRQRSAAEVLDVDR